jgi:hypothetical protein
MSIGCMTPRASRWDESNASGTNPPALLGVLYLRIIMIATMIATITATMMMIISGLLIIWRSIPNLVPSASNAMPHFGHFPGVA